MIKILGKIALAIGVVAVMYGIKMLDLPVFITGILVTALLIYFVYNLTDLSDDKKKPVESKSPIRDHGITVDELEKISHV